MTKVKGPTQAPPPEASVPPAEAKPTNASKASTQALPPDAYQKVAQSLLGYKSSPLVSGAYKIFSDGVVFPSNLLNTADPENDAKYLRLLAALWGMDDLEKYFQTLTDEQEKKRKVDRDERQKKKKEESESSEDEESGESKK